MKSNCYGNKIEGKKKLLKIIYCFYTKIFLWNWRGQLPMEDN